MGGERPSRKSALETEAEAMRVVLETDSMALKRLIKGEEPMWPRMKPLM